MGEDGDFCADGGAHSSKVQASGAKENAANIEIPAAVSVSKFKARFEKQPPKTLQSATSPSGRQQGEVGNVRRFMAQFESKSCTTQPQSTRRSPVNQPKKKLQHDMNNIGVEKGHIEEGVKSSQGNKTTLCNEKQAEGGIMDEEREEDAPISQNTSGAEHQDTVENVIKDHPDELQQSTESGTSATDSAMAENDAPQNQADTVAVPGDPSGSLITNHAEVGMLLLNPNVEAGEARENSSTSESVQNNLESEIEGEISSNNKEPREDTCSEDQCVESTSILAQDEASTSSPCDTEPGPAESVREGEEGKLAEDAIDMEEKSIGLVEDSEETEESTDSITYDLVSDDVDNLLEEGEKDEITDMKNNSMMSEDEESETSNEEEAASTDCFENANVISVEQQVRYVADGWDETLPERRSERLFAQSYKLRRAHSLGQCDEDMSEGPIRVESGKCSSSCVSLGCQETFYETYITLTSEDTQCGGEAVEVVQNQVGSPPTNPPKTQRRSPSLSSPMSFDSITEVMSSTMNAILGQIGAGNVDSTCEETDEGQVTKSEMENAPESQERQPSFDSSTSNPEQAIMIDIKKAIIDCTDNLEDQKQLLQTENERGEDLVQEKFVKEEELRDRFLNQKSEHETKLDQLRVELVQKISKMRTGIKVLEDTIACRKKEMKSPADSSSSPDSIKKCRESLEFESQKIEKQKHQQKLLEKKEAELSETLKLFGTLKSREYETELGKLNKLYEKLFHLQRCQVSIIESDIRTRQEQIQQLQKQLRKSTDMIMA